MEVTDGQIQLVLNTRSGTRKNITDFSSCRWRLQDPVFLPSNEYVMSVSTNFLTMPNDHFRVTKNRKSTEFHIYSKPLGSTWSEYAVINIPEGSYTINSFINTINLKLTENNIDFLIVELSSYSRLCILKCTQNKTDEYAFGTSSVVGYESGAEIAGFSIFPDTGVKSAGDTYEANRPADLHGTQTITIKASMNAQNNLDPSSLTRKRSVLAVIPAHSSDLNKPGTWDQYLNKEHVLAGICMDVIELTLEDDMGLALNPNNHWAISLEIKFKKKAEVTTKPSRKF